MNHPNEQYILVRLDGTLARDGAEVAQFIEDSVGRDATAAAVQYRGNRDFLLRDISGMVPLTVMTTAQAATRLTGAEVQA